MDIFVFVLGVIGMTHIVVDGAILNWFRKIMKTYLHPDVYNVFECYQCSGFWCGLILSILYFVFPIVFWILGMACAGSFLAQLGATYLTYLEARSIINISSEE